MASSSSSTFFLEDGWTSEQWLGVTRELMQECCKGSNNERNSTGGGSTTSSTTSTMTMTMDNLGRGRLGAYYLLYEYSQLDHHHHSHPPHHGNNNNNKSSLFSFSIYHNQRPLQQARDGARRIAQALPTVWTPTQSRFHYCPPSVHPTCLALLSSDWMGAHCLWVACEHQLEQRQRQRRRLENSKNNKKIKIKSKTNSKTNRGSTTSSTSSSSSSASASASASTKQRLLQQIQERLQNHISSYLSSSSSSSHHHGHHDHHHYDDHSDSNSEYDPSVSTGTAGIVQAILWLRIQLQEPDLFSNVVVALVVHLLQHGKRTTTTTTTTTTIPTATTIAVPSTIPTTTTTTNENNVTTSRTTTTTSHTNATTSTTSSTTNTSSSTTTPSTTNTTTTTTLLFWPTAAVQTPTPSRRIPLATTMETATPQQLGASRGLVGILYTLLGVVVVGEGVAGEGGRREGGEEGCKSYYSKDWMAVTAEMKKIKTKKNNNNKKNKKSKNHDNNGDDLRNDDDDDEEEQEEEQEPLQWIRNTIDHLIRILNTNTSTTSAAAEDDDPSQQQQQLEQQQQLHPLVSSLEWSQGCYGYIQLLFRAAQVYHQEDEDDDDGDDHDDNYYFQHALRLCEDVLWNNNNNNNNNGNGGSSRSNTATATATTTTDDNGQNRDHHQDHHHHHHHHYQDHWPQHKVGLAKGISTMIIVYLQLADFYYSGNSIINNNNILMNSKEDRDQDRHQDRHRHRHRQNQILWQKRAEFTAQYALRQWDAMKRRNNTNHTSSSASSKSVSVSLGLYSGLGGLVSALLQMYRQQTRMNNKAHGELRQDPGVVGMPLFSSPPGYHVGGDAPRLLTLRAEEQEVEADADHRKISTTRTSTSVEETTTATTATTTPRMSVAGPHQPRGHDASTATSTTTTAESHNVADEGKGAESSSSSSSRFWSLQTESHIGDAEEYRPALVVVEEETTSTSIATTTIPSLTTNQEDDQILEEEQQGSSHQTNATPRDEATKKKERLEKHLDTVVEEKGPVLLLAEMKKSSITTTTRRRAPATASSTTASKKTPKATATSTTTSTIKIKKTTTPLSTSLSQRKPRPPPIDTSTPSTKTVVAPYPSTTTSKTPASTRMPSPTSTIAATSSSTTKAAKLPSPKVVLASTHATLAAGKVRLTRSAQLQLEQAKRLKLKQQQQEQKERALNDDVPATTTARTSPRLTTSKWSPPSRATTLTRTRVLTKSIATNRPSSRRPTLKDQSKPKLKIKRNTASGLPDRSRREIESVHPTSISASSTTDRQRRIAATPAMDATTESTSPISSSTDARSKIVADNQRRHDAREAARVRAEQMEEKRQLQLAERRSRLKAEEDARIEKAKLAKQKVEEVNRAKVQQQARLRAQRLARKEAAEEARRELAHKKAEGEKARVERAKTIRKQLEEANRAKVELQIQWKAEKAAKRQAREEAKRLAEHEARMREEEAAEVHRREEQRRIEENHARILAKRLELLVHDESEEERSTDNSVTAVHSNENGQKEPRLSNALGSPSCEIDRPQTIRVDNNEASLVESMADSPELEVETPKLEDMIHAVDTDDAPERSINAIPGAQEEPSILPGGTVVDDQDMTPTENATSNEPFRQSDDHFLSSQTPDGFDCMNEIFNEAENQLNAAMAGIFGPSSGHQPPAPACVENQENNNVGEQSIQVDCDASFVSSEMVYGVASSKELSKHDVYGSTDVPSFHETPSELEPISSDLVPEDLSRIPTPEGKSLGIAPVQDTTFDASSEEAALPKDSGDAIQDNDEGFSRKPPPMLDGASPDTIPVQDTAFDSSTKEAAMDNTGTDNAVEDESDILDESLRPNSTAVAPPVDLSRNGILRVSLSSDQNRGTPLDDTAGVARDEAVDVNELSPLSPMQSFEKEAPAPSTENEGKYFAKTDSDTQEPPNLLDQLSNGVEEEPNVDANLSNGNATGEEGIQVVGTSLTGDGHSFQNDSHSVSSDAPPDGFDSMNLLFNEAEDQLNAELASIFGSSSEKKTPATSAEDQEEAVAGDQARHTGTNASISNNDLQHNINDSSVNSLHSEKSLNETEPLQMPSPIGHDDASTRESIKILSSQTLSGNPDDILIAPEVVHLSNIDESSALQPLQSLEKDSPAPSTENHAHDFTQMHSELANTEVVQEPTMPPAHFSNDIEQEADIGVVHHRIDGTVTEEEDDQVFENPATSAVRSLSNDARSVANDDMPDGFDSMNLLFDEAEDQLNAELAAILGPSSETDDQVLSPETAKEESASAEQHLRQIDNGDSSFDSSSVIAERLASNTDFLKLDAIDKQSFTLNPAPSSAEKSPNEREPHPSPRGRDGDDDTLTRRESSSSTILKMPMLTGKLSRRKVSAITNTTSTTDADATDDVVKPAAEQELNGDAITNSSSSSRGSGWKGRLRNSSNTHNPKTD